MKPIAAFLLTVVVAACSSGYAHHDLLSKAEQLVDLYPDSALRILSSINTDSLTTEDERAHYGLLQAEASHGAGIPLASDSLINYSLLYYERQGDQRLLTRALLHQGIALYNLQQTEKAVTLLKQAEQKAKDSDDHLMRFLLYSVLGDINDNIDNYATAIDYYRSALTVAQQSGNVALQVRALNNLTTTLDAAGQHNEAQETAIVIDTQAQFDRNTQQRSAMRTVIWLLAIIVALLACTLGAVLYHRRHIARLHREIDELNQRYLSWHIDEELLSAPPVSRLHRLADRGQAATNDDWAQLQQLLRQQAPDFLARLNAAASLTPKEQNVCLLIRLRFIPSELAVLTGTSPQTITNMRVRLLQKLFHTKGGARDFDARMQEM